MSDTGILENLRQRTEQIPSERDWEIYRHVKVEEWSTRTTADAFGISQTRVCQIVERVAEYVVATARVLTKKEEAQRLAASKQLAAERINHLYGEALRCFHRSKCTESIVRQSHEHGKGGCTTTRENRGDTRYLQAAARLALLGGTLPQMPPRTVETDVTPANEDCSPAVAEQAEMASAVVATPSATAAAMVSCVAQSRSEPAAASALARPVQPPGGKSLTPRQSAQREAFFQPS